MKSITIRWVLAHDPIELFIRAGKRFAEEVSKKTNGAVKVEVMTVSEYSDRYNDGIPVSRHDLLKLMEEGRIEMSQTYTTSLVNMHFDMAVLDLPFLFKDHDHAARVLDGEIGKELMAGLAAKTNIQGLAFTYSGGNRMIAATKPIRSVEDLAGMKIRIAKSEVAEATFRSVGAEPVPMDLEEINFAMEKGSIQGGESTYPRFYSMKQNEVSSVINDTQHSLFLTSILVANEFWANLDAELKKILSDAAMSAALVERRESIEDIDTIRERCKEDGISVIELPESEREKFRAATAKVHTEFEPKFAHGLVRRIKSA